MRLGFAVELTNEKIEGSRVVIWESKDSLLRRKLSPKSSLEERAGLRDQVFVDRELGPIRTDENGGDAIAKGVLSDDIVVK